VGDQMKVATLMQRVTAGQGARSAKREDAAAQHGISVQEPEPLRANRRVIENDEYVHLVMVDGTLKQILKRHEKEGNVFIDWLSVTVSVSGFLIWEGRKSLTNEDIAASVSSMLCELLGRQFSISKKNEFGMHFHPESYTIGESWGFFCIGHKSNRFLLIISGEGWLHAPADARIRLHDWLKRLDEHGGAVKISRIDLAIDYYEDGPTHDQFRRAYENGEFVRQQRHIANKDCWPHYQIFGCTYTKRGLEKGITDAIGVRTSDLYLRRYDKGKAEGDANSGWVRVELELKAKDVLLSLNLLLQPEAYFCQYPWLQSLRSSFAERLEARAIRAEINIEDAKRIIKKQFGKYLRVFRDMAESADELLNQLQSDEDVWPQRLAKLAPGEFIPFHKRHNVPVYQFENEIESSGGGLPDEINHGQL